MKTKYIMPAITVCDIETELMIGESGGQLKRGLAKQNNNFSFDDSIEDEEDDDDCGYPWSSPMYFGINE